MPMTLTDTPKRPFDKVYMDMVGPLPISTSGNKYILTFQDDFSKYLVCVAMTDAEAQTVSKAFFNEIIAMFGTPRVLITDNGTNFMSELFSNTCELLGIRKLNITPYHPQANGSLERSHRPFEKFCRRRRE